MRITGPFWRRRPTAATTLEEWGWCYLWVDQHGNVRVVEWQS